MSEICEICRREFEHVGVFSKWLENGHIDTFACVKCKMIRSANEKTCLSCKYYDTSNSDSADNGKCLRCNRNVAFADYCKQYEEDEE